MDVEGSAANAAGVTSQGYLTRYRGSLSRGEMYRGAEARFPLYAERIRVARRRGQPRRRTRADVSGPRPRPQAVVTSRSPRPGGRGAGGSWEKTATRSAPTTAWGQQKAGAVRPPRRTCPHLWGPGGGMPPMRRRSRGRRGGRPRIAHGQQGPWPRIARGQQGPGAASAVPRPLWAGTATGGARMDRAPCARDHSHQGRASGPPRRIPQMSRSCLWQQGTMSVARMGLAPMPPTRTAVRSVGRRDAAGRPCHGSRRARVHPREDAQSGGRAVANASARGDANEKASAVAQRPPMRIRRGASRRPTDGGLPRPGRSFVPARRPFPARRRWPPARTPLLDYGTDLRHDAESVVPGLGRISASSELRQGGNHSWFPRFDAASSGVSMASLDACPCAECADILPRETISVCA